MAIEDKLIGSWANQDRRSLLDLATGGRAKHGGTGKYRGEAGAIPQLSTTGKVTPENLEWLHKRFFPDEVTEIGGHKVVGGPGWAMEAASPAGIIRKANTASKMFSGWRDNLLRYVRMKRISKKSRKKLDWIINSAFDDLSDSIDSGDINHVQQKLVKINKENDLGNLVKVPDITTEGVAGGVIKQSKKIRGAPIEEQQRIANRQSRDLAAERRAKSKQERIDKGLERGSRRSGKY